MERGDAIGDGGRRSVDLSMPYFSITQLDHDHKEDKEESREERMMKRDT